MVVCLGDNRPNVRSKRIIRDLPHQDLMPDVERLIHNLVS